MATVKGVWVFNSHLKQPLTSFGTCYVNFKSKDNPYTYLSIVSDSSLYYRTSDGGSYVYSFGTDTWTEEVYRIIDFGTTPQEVSASFYTWLTENATQQGGEDDDSDSTVTDLTNTTWVINDATCDAGYGMFDVVTDSYGSSCRLGIGYNWDHRATGSYPEANIINSFDVGDFPVLAFNIGDSITFYGGSDVTNTSLISWVSTHATQQAEEETTSTATITYNGNVIATITDGQTATLPCKGKKMVGDIVIAYGVDAVNLISFTIDGTSYQAEEGMTWEQWANSSYNTAGAYATGLNYSINGKWIADARNGGAVLHQDAIKANREYFLKDHTGGGGND